MKNQTEWKGLIRIMNGWIQIPLETSEELNVNEKVRCRMINADKIDELFLDISGRTGCITALKEGKTEILCTADSKSVTGIWLDLLHSLSADTVDLTGDHKDHPVNYMFPYATEDIVDALVNTFLIKTSDVHTEEDLKEYERLFLLSLFGYICSNAPVGEQCIETLNEMLNAYIIRDGDREFKNAVDMLFDDREAENPYCREVADYKKFKQLTLGKQKRVLKSCISRMECLGFMPKVEETKEESASSWDGCSNW